MAKILIVEDDAGLRNSLREEFNNSGFVILEAGDGEAALEIAAVDHPGLILLDIIVPKINGMDVLKRLRGVDWGKKTPVILLTNLSDRELVAHALNEGANDFLIKKDWMPHEVVRKVRAWLRQEGKIE